KSAIKRIRTNEKARLRNKHYRSLMKTAIKKVRLAETKEIASANLNNAISILDRLAVKGIIHKNNAANKKSKLTQLVNHWQ
ncbi:MAG TPA: 30S ribosomal protein S20, partial [Bacteroidetes bacterium]|nr:30S ribosomal protein S20 [Bacteroidota bacterium]